MAEAQKVAALTRCDTIVSIRVSSTEQAQDKPLALENTITSIFFKEFNFYLNCVLSLHR